MPTGSRYFHPRPKYGHVCQLLFSIGWFKKGTVCGLPTAIVTSGNSQANANAQKPQPEQQVREWIADYAQYCSVL